MDRAVCLLQSVKFVCLLNGLQYRIGQEREVQVIRLVIAGTIEELMDEVKEKKMHLATMTIGQLLT